MRSDADAADVRLVGVDAIGGGAGIAVFMEGVKGDTDNGERRAELSVRELCACAEVPIAGTVSTSN